MKVFWKMMVLFLVIICTIQLVGIYRDDTLQKNGYYSITETIKKTKDRFGMEYTYTFKTKFGELRKGSLFIHFYGDVNCIDVYKQYFVVYSPFNKRINVLLKNRIVPDSINLDSLRDTKISKKEWSYWDL